MFDTPSGQTITVPVREHHNQYVALLDHAREAGFYLARVSVQSPGMPIAVNVNTRESNVKCLSAFETASRFEGTGITVAHSEMDLRYAIEQARAGRSFWLSFMIAGLTLLVVESLFADRLLKNPSPAKEPAPASTHTEDAHGGHA